MAKQLTGDELKQFKKDLTELNRLRKELGKDPITFEANVNSVKALNELLDSTRDIVNDLDTLAIALYGNQTKSIDNS